MTDLSDKLSSLSETYVSFSFFWHIEPLHAHFTSFFGFVPSIFLRDKLAG